MKCVAKIYRYTMDGLPVCDAPDRKPEIKRVTNERAYQLVATGKFVYTPKSMWKAHGRV